MCIILKIGTTPRKNTNIESKTVAFFEQTLTEGWKPKTREERLMYVLFHSIFFFKVQSWNYHYKFY